MCGFTRTELIVVLALLGTSINLSYQASQQASEYKNPKGIDGETVPKNPPSESNRVVHATGLSIVAPANWDQIRETGAGYPFLCIAARGPLNRRLKSIITVMQCDQPADRTLQGCQTVTYQDTLAYEQMRITKPYSFDDGARSEYDLYFYRDPHWWHINFRIADAITVLPNEIRQYINTVHFP